MKEALPKERCIYSTERASRCLIMTVLGNFFGGGGSTRWEKKPDFLTLRNGFHDVQKAHEQTAGFRLVQLVAARAVANQGLRTSKLWREIQIQDIHSQKHAELRVSVAQEYKKNMYILLTLQPSVGL